MPTCPWQIDDGKTGMKNVKYIIAWMCVLAFCRAEAAYGLKWAPGDLSLIHI